MLTSANLGRLQETAITVGKNVQGSRIKPYLTSKGWLLWAYAAPLPSRLLTPPLTPPHASQSNKPSIKISYRPTQLLHFIPNLYHSWVTVNAYIDRCPLSFVSIPNWKRKNNCWTGLGAHISVNIEKKTTLREGVQQNKSKIHQSHTNWTLRTYLKVFHAVCRSHVLTTQAAPWNLQIINIVGFFPTC